MRKVFVEPEVHRIELNLHENIASSITSSGEVSFNSQAWMCPIVYTSFTLEELIVKYQGQWKYYAGSCISYNPDATTYGLRINSVSIEEVYRRYGY